MEVLIQLLQRKNLCYKSFYQLCAEFLEEIATGNTEGLEDFQRKRQGIINVLEKLETDVSRWLDHNKVENTSNLKSLGTSAKEEINDLFRQKDSIVKGIVDLDLQILRHIDRIKDETIAKLQAVNASKRTIGAYRSPLETVERAETKAIGDREA